MSDVLQQATRHFKPSKIEHVVFPSSIYSLLSATCKHVPARWIFSDPPPTPLKRVSVVATDDRLVHGVAGGSTQGCRNGNDDSN